MSRKRAFAAVRIAADSALTAAALLTWLFIWPFYRLAR
jgi:hypothetical protein